MTRNYSDSVLGDRESVANGSHVARTWNVGKRRVRLDQAIIPKPVKTAKPRRPRTGVCAQVIAAIGARWTSTEDLMALPGWQRHTRRGHISTVAGNDGSGLTKQQIADMLDAELSTVAGWTKPETAKGAIGVPAAVMELFRRKLKERQG
jgi:hypothetical protein